MRATSPPPDAARLTDELQALLGPWDPLSPTELDALVRANVRMSQAGSAGATVELPRLVGIVEHLCDYLARSGTFVEGVFRLSCASATLDALVLLVSMRPEKVSAAVLHRAGAVAIACLLKRLLARR